MPNPGISIKCIYKDPYYYHIKGQKMIVKIPVKISKHIKKYIYFTFMITAPDENNFDYTQSSHNIKQIILSKMSNEILIKITQGNNDAIRYLSQTMLYTSERYLLFKVSLLF